MLTVGLDRPRLIASYECEKYCGGGNLGAWLMETELD